MGQKEVCVESHKPNMSGARILWECLEREGVQHVFGYPGGAILPVYDALKHSKIGTRPSRCMARSSSEATSSHLRCASSVRARLM